MIPFITQVPWVPYKLKIRHQFRLASTIVQISLSDPTNLSPPVTKKCEENTGETMERVTENNSVSGKYAHVLCSIPHWGTPQPLDVETAKSHVMHPQKHKARRGSKGTTH